MQDDTKQIEEVMAKRMIKDGELSFEKIAKYVPTLSMEGIIMSYQEIAKNIIDRLPHIGLVLHTR